MMSISSVTNMNPKADLPDLAIKKYCVGCKTKYSNLLGRINLNKTI
jgi:hypothetical protein